MFLQAMEPKGRSCRFIHSPSQVRDEPLIARGETSRAQLCESAQRPKSAAMLRAALASLVAFASLLLMPATANARLQCVAYARQIGDVQLSGNGRDWWSNAAGVYARGQRPQAGAVLAFKASGAMPYGHVAVVSKVVDDRHILINHANWSAPGLIERGVEVVDISPAGDWSQVRVWYGKTRSLGLRPSPTFGFIYPSLAPATVTASNDVVVPARG